MHFDFYEDSKSQVDLDHVLNATNLNISNFQLIKLQVIRALVANPEILIIDSFFDTLSPTHTSYLVSKIQSIKHNLIFILITGNSSVAKLFPKTLKF